MFRKREDKKPKLQVYMRSADRPNIDLLTATSDVRAKSSQPPDQLLDHVLRIIDMGAIKEIELSQESGLYFSLFENTCLLLAKRDAEELGCEYEFIDLRTGSLMDLDEKGGAIRIVGKKKLDRFERNLPAPCFRVKNAVLPFDPEPGHPVDVKQFYLINTRQD